jgi:hypothetical protein
MKDLSCQLDIPWIIKSSGFNVPDMKLNSEIEKQGRPVAKSAELIPKLFSAFSGQIVPHVMLYLLKQGMWNMLQLQLQEQIVYNESPS